MTQNKKRIGLLFLVGTLVSLVLLSTGISNLQFYAGTPAPPHKFTFTYNA